MTAANREFDVAGEPPPPGGSRHPQRRLGEAPGEHQIQVVTHAERVVWCSGRIRPAVYDPVDERRQAGASPDLADRHPVHWDLQKAASAWPDLLLQFRADGTGQDVAARGRILIH